MDGFLVDSRKVVSRDTTSLAVVFPKLLARKTAVAGPVWGNHSPNQRIGKRWGRASRLTVWSAFSSDLGTVSVDLFLGSALWGRNPMADPYGRAL